MHVCAIISVCGFWANILRGALPPSRKISSYAPDSLVFMYHDQQEAPRNASYLWLPTGYDVKTEETNHVKRKPLLLAIHYKLQLCVADLTEPDQEHDSVHLIHKQRSSPKA